ncbi:hypothetical protein HA402_010777 [Bradysia odoriphaga]|nr:hypothetical protein HA402_010777 [Bradysia odoriphaga]
MSLEQIVFCESCVPSYCAPYCRSKKIPTGTLYLNCERLKHNGLQDDCRRTKCEKNENCFAGKASNMIIRNMPANDIKHNGLQQEYQRGKYKIKQEFKVI